MKINPVLYKELKVRMRSWRAAGMVTVYLSMLVFVITIYISMSTQTIYSSSVDYSMVVGSYSTLAVIQFILILFISPALTAGAISGEREKQTLDLLICTRLRPISIILGKMIASISQIILLIVSSFPIFAIVFYFGGISIYDILKLFLFYLIIAITLGSIGIFYSTYFKRTTAANVLTYGTILFMIFGTVLIAAFYLQLVGARNTEMVKILYANPVVGFTSLIFEQIGTGGNISGIFTMGKGIYKTWYINSVFNLSLSVVLLYLSAIKINPIGGFKLKEKGRGINHKIK